MNRKTTAAILIGILIFGIATYPILRPVSFVLINIVLPIILIYYVLNIRKQEGGLPALFQYMFYIMLIVHIGSLLFKIMHWPGAGLAILINASICIFYLFSIILMVAFKLRVVTSNMSLFVLSFMPVIWIIWTLPVNWIGDIYRSDYLESQSREYLFLKKQTDELLNQHSSCMESSVIDKLRSADQAMISTKETPKLDEVESIAFNRDQYRFVMIGPGENGPAYTIESNGLSEDIERCNYTIDALIVVQNHLLAAIHKDLNHCYNKLNLPS